MLHGFRILKRHIKFQTSGDSLESNIRGCVSTTQKKRQNCYNKCAKKKQTSQILTEIIPIHSINATWKVGK